MFPQQHPWQMVRCPITSRFVASVDVSEICAELENHAREWEAELPSSEDDGRDNDDIEEWNRPDMSDDTSAMFDDLLNELNETDT
jgi:hypothetical protein